MTQLAGNITITPDDLLRLPDAVSYELVDGQLVGRHVSIESSRIAIRISTIFSNFGQMERIEVYGPDLGYQCFPDEPERIRKPDVSVIRKDRLTGVAPDSGYMPIPADLAVEVISPNDLAYEVTDKVREYLSAGFKVVWVVHPKERTVHVYEADKPVLLVHDYEEVTLGEILPGFHNKVSEFFL